MNERERTVQDALGSLNKYQVCITRPVLGVQTLCITVKAENQGAATERAKEIIHTIGTDDNGIDIPAQCEWSTDLDPNGEDYYEAEEI